MELAKVMNNAKKVGSRKLDKLPLDFKGLEFEEVLGDLLKVKPDPNGKRKVESQGAKKAPAKAPKSARK